MANQKHLEILLQGIKGWNLWREANNNVVPDLERANLSQSNLTGTNINEGHLSGANLSNARLGGANLHSTRLRTANLQGANLSWADLRNADFRGADFNDLTIGFVTFGNNDLGATRGLGTVKHIGPSTLDIGSLYLSEGKIPNAFLIGCGAPDGFVTYIQSIIEADQPIKYYSCFISYSQRDEGFVSQLYSRLRDVHLRVWFAREDTKGGEKLYEQISKAIQIHDRLLIVLSDESMKSEWVMTEIRRAKKVEREENRRKLFPIRLVDFESIQKWECFDADSRKDLAVEVREYYIPDFSNWKDHDAFETEFAKLLRDLKATES